MARPLRIEYPGAIYHITCRMLGNAQSRLFVDQRDADRFIERLKDRVEQFGVRLYMFVLMRNHVHLVLETPEGNCSAFMQSLSTAYTIYYNLRHQRHGHLLDGRFKSKVVEGDDYLLQLSRYVHLNPVKIKSMETKSIPEKRKLLREYAWSTYPGYIGKSRRYDFVDYEPILGSMGRSRKSRPAQYRKYVETGLGYTDGDFLDSLHASPLGLGGDEFLATVDSHYREAKAKSKQREDVSFRRTTTPWNAEEVLRIAGKILRVEVHEFRERRRNSPLRAIAAGLLSRYTDLTQRQIAKILGMETGAAVNKQLRRWKEIVDDPDLAYQLGKTAEKLNVQKRNKK